MRQIPNDPVPYAEFIVRHLMQPTSPREGSARAVAETEHAVAGDRWFWADDNAKILELMALPELWRHFPGAVAQIFGFIEDLCEGSFIFRRTGHPRLEQQSRDDGTAYFLHTFLHVQCNLAKGEVNLGMRFHDGRTARNVVLTGNYVQFTYDGARYTLDVEEAISGWDIDLAPPRLTLTHRSALHFEHNGQRIRLGEVAYTYRIDDRSMFVDVEVELELDLRVTVSEVVLTVGHDELSHGENNVHYGTIHADVPGTPPLRFDAPEPGHHSMPAAGAIYWSMGQQDEMRGFALGIHCIPAEPGRLASIEANVRDPRRLHYVTANYRFPERITGGRLRIAERKLITAGGFYDLVGEYSSVFRRRAAEPILADSQPLDLSVSYDYGAELVAFARCHRALVQADIGEDGQQLRDRSRALFDRFHQSYVDNILEPYRHDRSAIFSRPLSFVAIALVDMWQATGDEHYQRALRDVVVVLLDFEQIWEGLTGVPESGFAMAQVRNALPHMDCQGAALLALIRAAGALRDGTLAPRIDRALGALELATVSFEFYGKHKVDTLALGYRKPDGSREQLLGFWNFSVGLLLRAFNALDRTSVPELAEVAARHQPRLALFRAVIEWQFGRSLRDRDGCLEVLTSYLSTEGNSETQPWVTLAVVAASGDD